jgi:hypothetical protein
MVIVVAGAIVSSSYILYVPKYSYILYVSKLGLISRLGAQRTVRFIVLDRGWPAAFRQQDKTGRIILSSRQEGTS